MKFNAWFFPTAIPQYAEESVMSVGNDYWNAVMISNLCHTLFCLLGNQLKKSVLLGCSKSFESGNENTFFFGEITFIAQYNLP